MLPLAQLPPPVQAPERALAELRQATEAREFLRERLKKGRGDEAVALLDGIRRD